MSGPPRIERLFLCIGAQKAGTTWLARVLARHPDIFLTPVKEIHYFDHVQGITKHLSDRSRRARYRKYHQKLWTQWHRASELFGQWDWYRAYMRVPIDDAWYAGLFQARGGRAFAGEATPEYALIGEAGFRHVQRLAPDARIFYVLRNPVERAWSQMLHLCRRQRLDAARAPLAKLLALADSPAVTAHGDYARVLDDVACVFAPEQVYVAFHEDIHADRMAALKRICAFIGADFDAHWFSDLERRYNRSQDAPLRAPVRQHLRGRYASLARDIERRLGRIPESWAREFASDPREADAGLFEPRAEP